MGSGDLLQPLAADDPAGDAGQEQRVLERAQLAGVRTSTTSSPAATPRLSRAAHQLATASASSRSSAHGTAATAAPAGASVHIVMAHRSRSWAARRAAAATIARLER